MDRGLNDAVVEAVLGNQTTHNRIGDIFFTDDRVKVAPVHLLGELVHVKLKAEEQTA
jgi:type I restriction enzyme R subunit